MFDEDKGMKIFMAMIVLMIVGFVVAIGFERSSTLARKQREDADPSFCRPKTVAINQGYAHDLATNELTYCSNVAHRWRVESAVIICSCGDK